MSISVHISDKDKAKINELLNEPNFDDICAEIEQEFRKKKKDLRAYLAILIGHICSWGNMPEHFVWVNDNCPYDHSGILKEAGQIPKDISISDFLSKEYTGAKMPTFMSGRGWDYEKYNDELSYYTQEMAEDIMKSVISRHVNFDSIDNDFLFYDAIHDMFYDNTPTCNFFWAEAITDEDYGMFDPEEKICDIIAEARPDANAFEKAIRQAGANDDYYNVFCRIPKIASY